MTCCLFLAESLELLPVLNFLATCCEMCPGDSHIWPHLARCVAPGTAPGPGAPNSTPGRVAEEAAHGSEEEEGKAEAEPYGRESKSRHSISVVGAH